MSAIMNATALAAARFPALAMAVAARGDDLLPWAEGIDALPLEEKPSETFGRMFRVKNPDSPYGLWHRTEELARLAHANWMAEHVKRGRPLPAPSEIYLPTGTPIPVGFTLVWTGRNGAWARPEGE